MAANANNGIIDRPSRHSVDETLEKLKRTLQAKGVTVFAVVDHSGEAEKVGLKMRPTKLVIFGNPKAGTPLMQAAPPGPSTGVIAMIGVGYSGSQLVVKKRSVILGVHDECAPCSHVQGGGYAL